MPTPTEMIRCAVTLSKNHVLPLLEELDQKIQELEAKVELQRAEIEALKDRLMKNESVLVRK